MREGHWPYVQSTIPLTGKLLLAHHPLCGHFQEDLLVVGGRRLCLGCFLSYPIALAIVALWLWQGLPGEWYHHLLLGFGAGAGQFASLKGWTRRRSVKMLVKVALGFGFGLATVGVWGIPAVWWLRLFLFMNLSWTASMLAYMRSRNIERVCLECVWRGDWERCPGVNPPYDWREPRSGPDQTTGPSAETGSQVEGTDPANGPHLRVQ